MKSLTLRLDDLARRLDATTDLSRYSHRVRQAIEEIAICRAEVRVAERALAKAGIVFAAHASEISPLLKRKV